MAEIKNAYPTLTRATSFEFALSVFRKKSIRIEVSANTILSAVGL